MAIGKTLVYVECREIKFYLNDDEVSSNIFNSMKQPMNTQVVSIIDAIDGEVTNYTNLSLVDDPLVKVLFLKKYEVEASDEVVAYLMGFGSYTTTQQSKTLI